MNKGRLRFLTLLVVVVLLTVSGRLAWIQVVKAEWIAAESEKLRVQHVALTTPRGAILDRNLGKLAMSVPYYKVVANQFLITDKDEENVATKLAPNVGLTAEQILKTLRDNPRNGYIKIQEKLSLEQKAKIDELNLPGITLEDQSERVYPGKSLANQVLGYMSSDGKIGEDGIEKAYESFLAGKPGYVKAELTRGNTPIESTVKERVDPVRGENLVLSLDMKLQKLVEDKLDQVVKEQDAKRAAVIVMDVHTGEIVVMAMRPGAVPNDRKTWGDPVDWERLKNWTVTSLPPGSIFKTITSSAALEEQAINLNTTFYDKGELWVDGWRIANWDGYVTPNPAPMNLAQLMQRSSNIGLIQVGQKVSREAFVKYLQGFGFLEKTGIDLDYEEGAKVGEVPFLEKKAIDWANIYIGQHIEVTPLQMITAVSAIANGGKLVQPHLVRERRDPKDDRVLWTAPATVKRQVITEQTAKEVREIMVSVIEKGTASAAKLLQAGYTAGGKTGTAQKYENGKEKERKVADFVGFAPASNPQYAMLVVVDEPKGQGYGGQIAAPVFGELMPQVLRVMGVPQDVKPDGTAKLAPAPAQSGAVPDVTWMPAPWAEARLAEAGFVPRIKGNGNRVATQSQTPGAIAKPGTVIELNLVKVGEADESVHVPDFTGLSLTEANRLALEIGLTLKAGGSGFVDGQEPRKGTTAPARSTLTVRLAPRP
ncbi:MAG TPA: penicillin-binding transpeptidase domain-containing protein [Symbiobacteriaceae bacterium]|nr:penicillin-binding transpeptidase domain-containing protein [Symbiobacteriaceae bacterium]